MAQMVNSALSCCKRGEGVDPCVCVLFDCSLPIAYTVFPLLPFFLADLYLFITQL